MSQSEDVSSNKIRHITPLEEDLEALPSASYSCDLCGIKVKTQSNLRAHYIKTHGRVNDAKDLAFLLRKKTDITDVFHCPVASCKYAKKTNNGFPKYWYLKQHYQTVHMKKTFECSRCKQCFSTPNAQAYHSKNCGIQYQCPVCGRSYRAKKFLNQHARRTGHDIQSRGATTSGNSVTSTATTPAPPTNTQVDNPPTSVAILPLLVLPIGIGTDQITTSVISEAISQLRSHLTVLPPVTASSVLANSGALQLGYATTNEANAPVQLMAPPQQPVLHQQLQSHTQPALSVAVPGDNALVASFQQTSPEFGSSFVSLVDVGTATMRLSNAYTQTEVNLHPNCPRIPPMQMQAHQHQQQQSEFTLLYHMTRDSCIGTSPPDAVAHMSVGNSPPEFIPNMSHTSTFMSPGHSIELQYPEMNSNGTMTTYHQITTATATNSLQPVPTEDRFVQQTCPPLVPQQQQQQHAFQQTVPSSNVPVQMFPAATETSCYGFVQQMTEMPPNGGANLHYSDWQQVPGTSQEQAVCAKSVRMGTANSVAVETTFDLTDFDPNSSGNCCWPTADNFSHMQTQTAFDPEFDQWLNSVQTQTNGLPQQLPASTGWPSNAGCDMAGGTNDGVCVGVNTDLLTPENRSPYIH